MRPLTERQRETLDFLTQHVAAKGFAPSIMELCEHFRLSSIASGHKRLMCLVEKGYIQRRWGRSRNIQFIHDGKSCPTCGRAFPQSETA